ncbi:MAG: hypothetical protein QOE83_1989 [Actinomycetota bacterium]|nr:hypothetical protein [Actinomycetota bacterium]
MDRQKEQVIDPVREALKPSHVAHVALLPASLNISKEALGYPVLTWETLKESKEKQFGVSHFTSVLGSALVDWGSYVASWQTPFDQRSGQEIFDGWKSGTLEFPYMGRAGGFEGKQLAEDLTGSWKQQMYRLRNEETGSSNWFKVEAFVERLEAQA